MVATPSTPVGGTLEVAILVQINGIGRFGSIS